MTLEEAKEVLRQDINFYDAVDEMAIGTVLKALEDSIPKEKVRENIKELEEYKNNFWTTGEHDVAEDMYDYYELEQEIDFLKELLGE